jgi:hypothetical protein
MSDLHCWTNGIDTVVASSAEEAREVAVKMYGPDDIDAVDGDDGGWSQIPDDKVLSIYEDMPGTTTKLTAAEWVKRHGAGFLCSTEF